MEDAVGTMLGEGMADNAKGREGHYGADCPKPVGALIIDIDIGTDWVVEDVGISV